MNILKNILVKNKQHKNFFKIEKDENFYYVVKLRNSIICYTKDQRNAEDLIEQLNNKYDWSKVKDLNHLIEIDPDFYESIRYLLRSYAVPKRLNGNYLSTLNLHNIVMYRLSNERKVSGTHLKNGLAIRKNGLKFHLDNVYKGRTIVAMDSELHLISLYEETEKYIPWHMETINEAIEKDTNIKQFLKDVKESIENDKPIPSPDNQTLNRFKFIVMGGNDIEKQEAYVQAMTQLNNMVGLKMVKDKVDEFIKGVSANKKLKNMNLKIDGDTLHSLFVGPPGTGKTELARIMRDLMWSLDMIKERKIVELSKEDFVSSYIGGTEEITKEKVNEAIGGILFVDEAYMLKSPGGNQNQAGQQDFGKIALEIIMRAMENNRDDLMVIFAGYQKEINELLDENAGLKSRFAFSFQFEQYTPFELAEIANRMLIEKGFITKNIENNLNLLMAKEAKSGSLQGNARDVRVIVEKLLRKHKVRIVDHSGDLMIIHPDDVDSLKKSKTFKDSEGLRKLKESAEKELNELIGLENIKEEIISWTNYVSVEKKRMKIKDNPEPLRLHMSFEGQPGVGKTTVARIIAKILKGNGMLSNGHFVEVVGKDLVAGYMGQTSEKVKELVKSAMGGILFIDEAYSIVNGKDDMFGKEAVDTLIAEMENNGEDTVVILAGYTNEIEELFKSNPGFKSRISQRFEFKDYNSNELIELFKMKIHSLGFILDFNTIDTVSSIIQTEKSKNKIDGNARWIRNFIDKIKKAQANRIVNEDSDELYLIKPEDIICGFKKMI